MSTITDYQRDVIDKGDDGSRALAARTVRTLTNSPHVDIIKGVDTFPVLRVPQDYVVAVYNATGDPRPSDPAAHAHSLVDHLALRGQHINAPLQVFANVVDSKTGDLTLINAIGDGLAAGADKYGVAVMNGENAILGAACMIADANCSGTGIGFMKRADAARLRKDMRVTWNDVTTHHTVGIDYALFDPQGKAVYMNSDGVGTKVLMYQLAGNPEKSVWDFAAMNADDASKKAARARVLAANLETSGALPVQAMRAALGQCARECGFTDILHHEDIHGRIRGYWPEGPAYNLSGSLVSTIDEDRLRNPLVPKAGDTLLAIRGRPTPRSNGITAKREGAEILGKKWCEKFGVKHWSDTPPGKELLHYLTTPSTVFYPVFEALINDGLVSMVTHMSGGAYNGKLAHVLAKNNLYCEMDRLFTPDAREVMLMNALNKDIVTAHKQFPMGNEGFVATNKPKMTIERIAQYGLEANNVGVLQANGDTGIWIKDTPVRFSGKD